MPASIETGNPIARRELPFRSLLSGDFGMAGT
jgi:hypothetical protein